METTTAKRKRSATDIAGDESAATTVDEVSDAEVEEFYAILRRMRDASRLLCGAGARAPARAPAWRPSFSWEDFAPAAPPSQPADDERAVVAPQNGADANTAPTPPKLGGLDLNVEPEPDTPSSAPAPAPASPRAAQT